MKVGRTSSQLSNGSRSSAVTLELRSGVSIRCRRTVVLVVAIVLVHLVSGHLTAQTPISQDTTATSVGGHWEGEIQVPGMPLQVLVDLEARPDGAWHGTIDIPIQAARGLPLVDVEVELPRVKFTIGGVPGSPTFVGELSDGGELSGDFEQAGARFAFELGREAVTAPQRPQEPIAPVPYLSEEVVYRNGEVTLAATLTLPPGAGPHPAAVLITGSGAQNRDEELLGHKPFLVLADHLTRAGYAVLRSDDRGVGGSSGDLMSSTSAELAEDVLSAVRWLRQDERLQATAIGLIGHSEGGLIAPIVATAGGEEVAFVVSLAGTGVTGGEILKRQLDLIARANGVPEEVRARQLELQGDVIEVLRGSEPDEERRRQLELIVDQQIGLQGPAEGEAIEAAREQSVAAVLNRWFMFFVDYDPEPSWRTTAQPTLLLNGSLDLQVDALQNIPVMMKALLSGGNRDVTAQVLPHLNHLFQTTSTGSPQEYGMIEETFAPSALAAISNWLRPRFPPAKEGSSNTAGL